MTGVARIYKLKKIELIQNLEENGLDSRGSVSTLRQRFVRFIRENPDSYEDIPEDPENYNEEIDKTQDIKMEQDELSASASSQQIVYVPTVPDTIRIMEQMRKWNCHFDGKNVYEFIERVSELKEIYNIADEQLLKGFSELLRGEALARFRNNTSRINTWKELEEEIRNFYLSPGELRHLDRQIAERKQGPNEAIRIYIHALSTLMRRRGNIPLEIQLSNL